MFGYGYYGIVWDVKPVVINGQTVPYCCDARVSSSYKDKNGRYVNDFNGFVRFFNTQNGGTAATQLMELKPKPGTKYLAKIRFGNGGSKTRTVEMADGTKRTYTDHVCFGFTFSDQENSSQNNNNNGRVQETQQSRPIPSSFIDIPDNIGEEELPF